MQGWFQQRGVGLKLEFSRVRRQLLVRPRHHRDNNIDIQTHTYNWRFKLFIVDKRAHGSTAFHHKWLFTKIVITLIIIRYKIERNNLKFFFILFEFGKNIISEISWRLSISQNDSLGVLLLLVDICIEYKKGRNDPTDTFGG